MRFLGRSLLAALLLAGMAVRARADTEVGSDNFTRAACSSSCGAGGGLGANWTILQGTWTIASNVGIVTAAPGNTNPVYWSAASFTNDQYASMRRTAWQSTDHVGPAVRMDGSKNGYYVYCTVAGSGTCTAVQLTKATNGNPSSLVNNILVFLGPSDTLSISAAGTQISVLVNGTQVGTHVDSSYASGAAGMMTYNTFASGNGVSYWEGGNVGASTTVANPSFNPGAGTYLVAQTVTISSSTAGATLCYTTDGSTPTSDGAGTCTHGTTYTAPVTVSASQTLKALGSQSGLTDSAVVTADYVIGVADQPIASDSFASYINSDLAQNSAPTNGDYPYQFPLDLPWTSGAWAGAGITNFMFPATDNTDGNASQAIGVGGGQFSVASRAAELYPADQYSKAMVHVGAPGFSAEAGVGVRCGPGGSLAGGGYSLAILNGTVYLRKGFSTVIASAAGTYTDPAQLELRVLGSTLQPLLNGAAIAGMNATYVDGTYSSGQPCVLSIGFQYNGIYSWSAGRVGGANHLTVNLQDGQTGVAYSDALTSGPAWPWFNGRIGSVWLGNMVFSGGQAGVPNGGGSNQSLWQYRAPIATDQWQQYTVVTNTSDASVDAWFAPLQLQTWMPGISTCTHACGDETGYYPGAEPMNALSAASTRAAACLLKTEYMCTPYLHITKITPQNSPNNEVVTVAGSTYTPMAGDVILERYEHMHLEIYCKGHGANPSWQGTHAYSIGDVITDSNGNIQRVITAGTTGGTVPSPWGTIWNSTVGDHTTDGGVTWEFYGEPCPTNSSFSKVVDALDADLAAGGGFPAFWMRSVAGAEYFSNWTAGSITDEPSVPTPLGITIAVVDTGVASDSATGSSGHATVYTKTAAVTAQIADGVVAQASSGLNNFTRATGDSTSVGDAVAALKGGSLNNFTRAAGDSASVGDAVAALKGGSLNNFTRAAGDSASVEDAVSAVKNGQATGHLAVHVSL